jgi:ABC-type Zn2+ transport system substrate-binding protein/surface adhesin
MKKPYSCFRLAFALVAFALATTAGAASITAVGPAEFRAPAIAKSATPAMLLPPGSPAHRIELTAPTDAERAQLRAANAAATASRKVT